MALRVGIGKGRAHGLHTGSGGGVAPAYAPALKFNDLRNSGYVAVIGI